MAKKHIELWRDQGKGKVVLPGENAKPEEIQAFHHAIGVPKDAKEYGTFEFDGVKPDANMVKFASEIFPQAGVTKRGAEVLTKGWNKMMADTVKAAETAQAERLQQGEEAFAKAQGANHAASVDLANRAATHFKLTPEDVGALKRSLGVEKAMGFLLSVAHSVADDGENPAGGANSFTIQTKEGAKAELDRMNGDPSIGAILRDANHKEHKAVKAKWTRLADMVSGIAGG